MGDLLAPNKSDMCFSRFLLPQNIQLPRNPCKANSTDIVSRDSLANHQDMKCVTFFGAVARCFLLEMRAGYP